MGRPEGNDAGSYGSYSRDDQDQYGEVWKRGDPPSWARRPAYLRSADEIRRRFDDGRGRPREPDDREEPRREGRRCTEQTERPYTPGDRVRALRPAGGDLISHVPPDTKGRVVSTHLGFLGDPRVIVAFDNGYTEEVTPSDIEYRRWE